MKLQTKLLLSGFLLGALVLVAGYAGQLWTLHRLEQLRLACAKEDKRSKAQNPKSSFTLDCDPRSLTASDDTMRRRHEQALGTSEVVDYEPTPGVQGDMVRGEFRGQYTAIDS